MHVPSTGAALEYNRVPIWGQLFHGWRKYAPETSRRVHKFHLSVSQLHASCLLWAPKYIEKNLHLY